MHTRLSTILLASLLLLGGPASAGPRPPAPVPPASPGGAMTINAPMLQQLEEQLVTRHGAAFQPRIRQGLAQVAALWRTEDGTPEELAAFVKTHFLSDPQALEDTFRHLEYALEMLDGHAEETARELARFQSLDEGPLRPVDELLASFRLASHIDDDLFRSKVAFTVLLNFPLTTLEQRNEEGPSWSRAQWARARVASRFEHRLPAELALARDRAAARAERYIDGYDIPLDRVVDDQGQPLFRPGLKLISHWGLRDEIRAQYGQPDALPRQRAIYRVMERIIRQELPREILVDGKSQWNPGTNQLREPGSPIGRVGEREPDERYRQLLDYFQATRQADPYFPTLPTHVERSFQRDRELSEARVRELLESVLLSPTARKVGAFVSQQLGRPLEPFDLWYAGFRSRRAVDETALDRLTRERYPNVAAFQADLPRILQQLGFTPERAAWLGERIVVDPSRGPGHAYGARLRSGKAHLRTRFGPQGMDFKGFNIAIHELGHNVEQTFSTILVDHTLLQGVPNNGFTEAFAFLFQANDLALLGQQVVDPRADAYKTLGRFWDAYEISGTAILDMELWRWMYAHPDATPAQLRQATVELTQALWNRYYAPVFGQQDQLLSAIYSHLICFGLYTPDYPLGYLITFQLEQYLQGRQLGPEMERMTRQGRLTPDLWMQQAVGQPVSSAPLLAATEAALARLVGK